MGIQYAGGTIVHTTFSASSRRAVVDALAAALETAGWSYISGEGTDTVVMQSATDAQGNYCQMSATDPGSGNCAQIWLRNAAASAGRTHWIYPNSYTYRIIANKYQFFIMTIGTTNYRKGRQFLFLGKPYYPPFLGYAGEYGFSSAVGNSDTDSGDYDSWRYVINTISFSYQQFSIMTNGTISTSVDYTGTSGSIGGPSFLGFVLAQYPGGGILWSDGSGLVFDAIVYWAGGAFQTATARAVLYDAVIIAAPYQGDQTIYLDGHLFLAITNVNQYGTLFVAIT